MLPVYIATIYPCILSTAKGGFVIRKNIFACLFSVHNTISLSRHEQVCLMRLRFERYLSKRSLIKHTCS